MRRSRWSLLALARLECTSSLGPHRREFWPARAAATTPRVQMSRFQMSASGFCSRCQREHGIPTTPAALAAAAELASALEGTGRVDFDAVAGSGGERPDPRLGVRFLVEERGKLLGVLVTDDPRASAAGGGPRTVVLKAFSGKLNGHWTVPGWAPALYATERFGGAPEDIPRFADAMAAVTDAMALEADLAARGDRVAVAAAKLVRQDLSRRGMAVLRSAQVVRNYRGDSRTVARAFLAGEAKMPTGTGDCCATKLVAWAQSRGLRPTGIAEFYFGKRARDATRVREHVWYDACEPRCRNVLGFMLCGLEDDSDGGLSSVPQQFFAWSVPEKENCDGQNREQ
jgi:hypothetical protein